VRGEAQLRRSSTTAVLFEAQYLFGHSVTIENVNLSNLRLHSLRRIVYSLPL
jgi:hypothetical protein